MDPHFDLQFGLLGALITGESGLWVIALPLAAFILDMFFADPVSLPHPVCAVGRLLCFLESRLRGPGKAKTPAASGFRGLIGVLACLLVTGGVAFILSGLPWLGWLFALYLAWSGLALGGLRKEGSGALAAIGHEDIERGRAAMAMLVSRDTGSMDRPDLRRSLAETLSENFNDGFVAPFFWLTLLGPVGLWLYKAASTMDSMWGYKTPEWKDFGMVAARLDDLLAFVPARLSVAFLRLGSRFTRGCGPSPAWGLVRREASSMESPNAGWPMAAAAWLCGARMGGPTPYHGALKDKPLLGPPGSWTNERIHILLSLLFKSGWATAVILSLTAWLLLLIF